MAEETKNPIAEEERTEFADDELVLSAFPEDVQNGLLEIIEDVLSDPEFAKDDLPIIFPDDDEE